MDKSFDNHAMNLWVGNYLSGRNHVCWSAEFFISCCSIFYVAVTEASSSCVCKTAKLNFYQVLATKTYTRMTRKGNRSYKNNV